MTEAEPRTTRETYELSLTAPFPCWPDQPRYVVWLTKDVDRFLRRLALGSLMIWPVLFLFKAQIDTLWTAVFGKEVVSHFAFIRRQYEYLVASQKIEHFDPTRRQELAAFHLLEIATWLGIAMCATRLITGIAFLRQFDARYLIISRHFLANWLPLMTIWVGFCQYIIMVYPPKVGWLAVTMMYASGPYAIAQLLHFCMWKVFRQKWPWATLWHPDIQSNGLNSRK